MKVTHIELIDSIYHVTQTPSFFQKIFGKKEVIERYKWKNEVFHYFDHLKVFYKSTGELISATNPMCKILNNFTNKF